MTATQSDQLTASDVAHDRVAVGARVSTRERGARAAGRRLEFVPSEPARFAICLLYVDAFLSDMLVTVSGRAMSGGGVCGWRPMSAIRQSSSCSTMARA